MSPYLSAEKLSAFGEQVLYNSSDATLIFFIMLEIVGCNRFLTVSLLGGSYLAAFLCPFCNFIIMNEKIGKIEDHFNKLMT